MRKLIFLICLLVIPAIVMLIFKGMPQAKAAENNPPVSSGSRVIVYYFYGALRCSSCLKIEQYSREAIEKYFGSELKSGKLVFRAINVEEKGNEHFMSDYRLYTKSLVLSLIKNGEEIKSENLVKVWEYLGNKDKFYEYIKSNLGLYLREL